MSNKKTNPTGFRKNTKKNTEGKKRTKSSIDSGSWKIMKPGSTDESNHKTNRKSYSKPASVSKKSSNTDRAERDVKPGFVVKKRKPGTKKIVFRGNKAPKDEVRLNKFIANSGICSRREADDFIEAGVITINGKVVTELGTKVKPGDDVRFNGQRLQGEKKVYILLNKPKDYVTTVEDPHADKTVMELIKGACKERVYPVGRLDKNTTGVLLFTNDGELTKQLTHPSSEKMKVYHVFLDKKLSLPDLQKLVDGFTLEDGFIQADAAEYVDDKKSEVGLEIHSGRNRIVRRMFEHLGYKVVKLDRVYFAGLTKKGLKRGDWRILNPKEVNMLKIGAFK